MSSLRPAKFAATLFQLIGGSLADPAEPEGPPCACHRCELAWWRNQPRDSNTVRNRRRVNLRRLGSA